MAFLYAMVAVILEWVNSSGVLGQLYSGDNNTMMYTAKSILKDQYRAEDAVTQAYIKIIEDLQNFSFENCKKTKALVVIIVKNICYNMIKGEKRENTVPLEDFEDITAEAEDGPLDFAITEENYNFLLSCLSKLESSYQDILSLKLFYEYTDNEIAKMLDITPNNVYVRFHRAKKALIEEIQKRGSGYDKI